MMYHFFQAIDQEKPQGETTLIESRECATDEEAMAHGSTIKATSIESGDGAGTRTVQ